MQTSVRFSDLLEERRKDCDILWVSRPTDLLSPHMLPLESRLSRNQIIEKVLNDPRVKKTIEILKSTQNQDESVINKVAYGIINEMASKDHLPTVRWMAYFVTKAMKTMFSSIFINDEMIFNLKSEMRSYQMQYIYVPSHRSYLDFVLLSYILVSYDMALPNIASGMDFYQMRIVGELLRKTGAFYMRRSFSDDLLYKEIFKAYVTALVTNCDKAIEFFIEGTRSRSQKSIAPKYGILSIILDSFLRSAVPEIQFVPISISYERSPEELLYVYELLGVPKPKESTTALLRSLSILRKPQAHGCVFFHIAEPLSASNYIKMEDRKAKAMNPNYKVPSNSIESLAYDIIRCHQEKTVLTAFNIVALLFNEKLLSYPNEAYTLQELVQDYHWYKNFMCSSMGAVVHPQTDNTSNKELTKEIMDSLKIHTELLAFDASGVLRLKEANIQLNRPLNIKGHSLSIKTLRIAVPAINLAIYVNPILSFLAKLGIAAMAIGMNESHIDQAFKRYLLLRNLLSTEFAIRLKEDSSVLKREWEECINILMKENSLHRNNYLLMGQKTKQFSLLCNLILPFIDAVYFICNTLFYWDESTLGVITNQKVLVETQKQVEIALFKESKFYPHPYSLSLDLYSSTLSNFTTQGIVKPLQKEGFILVDKIQLAVILGQLRECFINRSAGSYVDISFLSHSQDSVEVQAKL